MALEERWHSFLFSIDNNECYYVNDKNDDGAGIKCDEENLCSFGTVTDNRLLDHCRSHADNYEYRCTYNSNSSLSGSSKFKVSELDVFEVIIY